MLQVDKQEALINTGSIIDSGGRFIIGQELDTVNGTFSMVQVFIGEMADFFISDVAMSVQDAQSYISCSPMENVYPVLYDFGEQFDRFQHRGNIEVYNRSKSEVCFKHRVSSLLYPELLEYYDGKKYCNKMGGSAFFPVSIYEENQLVYNYRAYMNQCIGTYSTQFWYGVVTNDNFTAWVSEKEGLPIQYSFFNEEFADPSSSHRCISSSLNLYRLWYRTPCTRTACVICQFPNIPEIRILGLCDVSQLERKLYLDQISNDKWTYVGLFRTRLRWANQTWTLYNNDGAAALTMTETRWTSVPLGLHEWTVVSDRCQNEKVNVLLIV